MADPNEAQSHHWNVEAGPGWVAKQEQMDRMLEPLGERALTAAAPAAGERAIDIGCGCGATTIALAERVGVGGSVLGVDISEPMLARAQERCDALGLTNVELRRADAQQAAIPEGHDLAFSRFGVMFFEDPVAAFGNIGRGLRDDGRVTFICWQARERNPWMSIPVAAALQHIPPPAPLPPDAPGPWSLSDPDRVRGILTAAGFDDVDIEPFAHQLQVGGAPNLEAAVSFAVDSGSVRSVLGDVDEDTRSRAADSIRIAFEPYAGPDGVRLSAATWIVRARRAPA